MVLSNNPPKAIIELDKEMTTFVLDNCESNLRLGVILLQNMMDTDNRAGAEKVVELIEKFKKLKKIVEKASDD